MRRIRLILDLHGDLPANSEAEHQLLDVRERDRANQFVFVRDRRQFIRAHSLLRRSLADALGVPASDVAYERILSGKPVLVGSARERCNFNMSHCAGGILIGLASEPIGVDIERTDGRPFPEEVFLATFTSIERSSLMLHSGGALTRASFAHWTRKEAVLKADGCGLSFEPSAFEIIPEVVQSAGREWSRDRWATSIRSRTYYGVTSVLRAGWAFSLAYPDHDQYDRVAEAIDALEVTCSADQGVCLGEVRGTGRPTPGYR